MIQTNCRNVNNGLNNYSNNVSSRFNNCNLSNCNKSCNNNVVNNCDKDCNNNMVSNCDKGCNNNVVSNCHKGCNNMVSNCDKGCNNNIVNNCDRTCDNLVNCNKGCSDKYELMEIITQASFALDDIKLFLDTHPCDVGALKAYEEYKKIRKVAWMEYTREYGPLSAYDVDVCNQWSWIEKPWPWEGGC